MLINGQERDKFKMAEIVNYRMLRLSAEPRHY